MNTSRFETYLYSFLNFLANNFFPLLLITITVIICGLNFTPDTWQTGWDTLHNEFDFSLSFNRNFFGVWREYQGLGAVAAHAESADLPRQIFIWIGSLVFPLNFLRYSYIFLTLIAGPLGVYFLLDRVVLKGFEKSKRNIAAFVGALYYLLNLATVQLFYVPFEMFQTQYAFLPWLLLFATKYFATGRIKHLSLFTLFTILALPQAYAAALFYAYILGMGVFFTAQLIYHSKDELKLFLKRSALLLLVTLTVNAYWLLPNIYYVFNHSQNVPNAIVNKAFSDEAFAYNEKFGSLDNVVLLKSFLFDWSMFDFKTSEFSELLGAWNNHLDNPLVLIIGYSLVVLMVFGVFVSFISKSEWRYGLVALLGIALFMLINTNLPTGPIFSVFIALFGFLKEAFRFVFNKFAVLALLPMVVFLAFGVLGVFTLVKKKVVYILVGGVVSIAIIVFGLPAFSGEMIGDSMRNDIPQEYFDLYEYMQDNEINGRIGKLPIQNYYGWSYYNWGYQGAGFLWFGLDAPLLDRDFDRWTPYNEQYYWEMSRAVYAQDLQQFYEVVNKYQIEWLIVDHNVIEPESNSEPLFFYEIHKLLGGIPSITREAKFGDVYLYHVDLSDDYQSFIFGPENVTSVSTNGIKDFRDITFNNNSNYIDLGEQSSKYIPFHSLYDSEYVHTEKTDLGYEFSAPIQSSGMLEIPDLANNLQYVPVEVAIETTTTGTSIIITPQLPQVLVDGQPVWNEISDYTVQTSSTDVAVVSINGSDYLEVDQTELASQDRVVVGGSRLSLLTDNNSIELRNADRSIISTHTIDKHQLADFLDTYTTNIDISDNSKEITVRIPNHIGYLQKEFRLTPEGYQNTEGMSIAVKSCADENPNEFQSYDKSIILGDQGGYTEYSSVNSSSCDDFGFWELGHDSGYVLAVEQNNISGFPLYICLSNYYSNKCDQRTRLEQVDGWNTQVFIQPPYNPEYSGYGVSIDTISFNSEASINQVRSIQMQAIPYEFIKSISIKYEQNESLVPAIITEVRHSNPFVYTVSIEPKAHSTILGLNQSYEKNWGGIVLEGSSSKLSTLNHLKLNNWANAFEVPPDTSKVFLIFYPQLLQFLGYIFLVGTLITFPLVLVKRSVKRN